MTSCSMANALAYIDPGSAGAMFTFLGPILAGAAALLGVILWPFRWVIKRTIGKLFKLPKAVWITVLALPVVALAGLGVYTLAGGGDGLEIGEVGKAKYDRILLLGMDGMEPKIIDRMMASGELPNFAKLRDEGYYSRIATSTPPESPVAWASIATGRNPGKHGIFDFIHRKPDYSLYLSITEANTSNITGNRSKAFLPTVKVPSFWKYTSEIKDMPTSVIRFPGAFPPEKVSGHFLSGFGVPDINSRQGAWTYYTTKPEVLDSEGRANAIRIAWNGRDAVDTELRGPMSKTTPLRIEPAPDGNGVMLKIGKGEAFRAEPRKWTEFHPVDIKLGLLQSIHGMVKFWLEAVEPDFRLYASPIEIDPLDPAYPISVPNEYAGELAKAIGNYHTLGMPEVTTALSRKCYGPDAFLEECRVVSVEREKMLDHELAQFKRGVLAFVFDTSDREQHMFWMALDPEHPEYDTGFAAQYGHVIPDMYKDMDRVLGKVLGQIDDKTLLLVMSDHGFNTFRRMVSLNTWLIDNGYQVLKDGEKYSDDALREKKIDWSRTKAYAIGFASLYFNVKGREKEGIVDPSEVPALIEEIGRKLRDLRDPKNGGPVVRTVYATREHYRGPEAANAPDVIIGFEEGYRASWHMALGGSSAQLIEDNRDPWCGDHLMDPQLVPGMLFSNQKLKDVTPRLIDIAPTILSAAGVKHLPDDMDGESLLRAE